MQSVIVNKVFLDATPGSTIDRSIKDALIYAIENECEVVLCHNENEYSMNWNTIRTIVEKVN